MFLPLSAEMDKIAFAPLIDLPLVVFTVAAFLWHFSQWASSNDLDTNVDVAARLPVARLRVITLFAVILILCWLLNLAVWSILALLLGIGIAAMFIAGGHVDGDAFEPWAAAYLIREWSFGFPQLILHPPSPTISVSTSDGDGELIGKNGTTTSPIRPTGNAEIDGVEISVSSADGRLIEIGTEVTVTAYRNGRPCVSPRS